MSRLPLMGLALGAAALATACSNPPVVLNRTTGPGHGAVSVVSPTGGQGQPPLLSGGTSPVAGPLTNTNVR